MSADTVTDATFAADVLDADLPVIVDFWAPWCQPCRQVAPVIDELGADYAGRVKVVKVNIDESPTVASRYGITGVPTVAVFDGGEQMLAITGAKPKRVYLQQLDPWLST